MKLITMTNGLAVKVDDEDYDLVSKYRWYHHQANNNPHYANTGYASTAIWKNGKCTTLYMHRLIMQPEGKQQIDHINRDSLDNQRSNLRIATNGQNSMNRPGYSATGRKGVYFNRGNRPQKYHVQIVRNWVKYELGCFDDLDEAARVYDEAARRFNHSEFAVVNG